MSTAVSPDRIARLKGLRGYLEENVIGQRHVIPMVVEALLDGELGLTDPSRPKGTFLFLGPTGVGKTELCLAFTRYLSNREDSVARFDMSEFQTQESLAVLIGGKLGERGVLGRRLDAIGQEGTLLFDEIEKAHPRVLDILLQILDAARITMADGVTIDLSGFHVVATSNIAAQAILESRRSVRATLVRFIERQAQAQLRPEVFARFNTVAVFDRLAFKDLEAIASHMLIREIRRHEEAGYAFTYDQATVRHLAALGFDSRLGARPMRTRIEGFVRKAMREALFADPGQREISLISPNGNKGGTTEILNTPRSRVDP
jgi:ATP-dependent Clp protease ATP-binding subunit ClpA